MGVGIVRSWEQIGDDLQRVSDETKQTMTEEKEVIALLQKLLDTMPSKSEFQAAPASVVRPSPES